MKSYMSGRADQIKISLKTSLHNDEVLFLLLGCTLVVLQTQEPILLKYSTERFTWETQVLQHILLISGCTRLLPTVHCSGKHYRPCDCTPKETRLSEKHKALALHTSFQKLISSIFRTGKQLCTFKQQILIASSMRADKKHNLQCHTGSVPALYS